MDLERIRNIFVPPFGYCVKLQGIAATVISRSCTQSLSLYGALPELHNPEEFSIDLVRLLASFVDRDELDRLKACVGIFVKNDSTSLTAIREPKYAEIASSNRHEKFPVVPDGLSATQALQKGYRPCGNGHRSAGLGGELHPSPLVGLDHVSLYSPIHALNRIEV